MTKSFLDIVSTAQASPFMPEQIEQSVLPNKPASYNAVMTEYYAGVFEGEDKETIHSKLEAGLEPLLKERALTRANDLRSTTALTQIDQLLAQSDDPMAELEDLRGDLLFSEFAAPDVAVMLQEGDLSEREKRTWDRLIAAERMVAERQERMSSGTASTIGYFLDTAVSGVIHNVLGAQAEVTGLGDETFEGAGQLIGLAEEAADVLSSDIPVENFEEEFGAILDRVSDAGLFTQDNPFYLSGFIELVKQSGAGQASTVERLFQLADVTTLGVANATRYSGTLAETPRVITRLRSREDAVSIVRRYGDTGVDGPILAENRPSAVRAAKADPGYFSGPELAAGREVEAANSALKAVRSRNWGAYVDPRIVREKASEWITLIRERNQNYYKHEVDVEIKTDEFGNIVGRAWLGKRGPGGAGQVYRTRKGAERLAEKVGGEVFETLDEGRKGWLVAREWNIPTEGLADATDVTQLASSWLSKFLSTVSRTSSYLDAILKQGEAQASSALRDLGRQYRKVRSQTSREGQARVDAILTELRDDPLYNFRTKALDIGEFRERFFTKYGELPDENTENFYLAIQEINDVDYFLNADAVLKEAVNNGERMVELDGQFFRGKPVEVPAGTNVWDLDASRVRPREDMAEGVEVWEIKDFGYAPGGGAPIRYVAGSNLKQRRLYHTDVMPYNTGGHRRYKENIQFFIKQEEGTTLRTGEVVPGRPKTFMGVRTEAEARTTVEQFNAIVDAIVSGKPISGSKTPPVRKGYFRMYHGGAVGGKNTFTSYLPRAKSFADEGEPIYYVDIPKDDPRLERTAVNDFRTTAEFTLTDSEKRSLGGLKVLREDDSPGLDTIDGVVLANNDWNHAIESFEDFQLFANEHGLSIHNKIDFAADGDILQSQTWAGLNTYGQTFRDHWNAKGRGARPLVGFGGDDLSTFDPTLTIERGFASSVNRFADKNYYFNAVNGWLKAAVDNNAITNPEAIKGLDPKIAMETAILRKGTELSHALEAERNTIRYALSQETMSTVKERRMIESAAEFVYGKGWKRTGRAVDWVASKDPAGALRSLAFHTKLGMFNPDQLYVQASQLVNIVGIQMGAIGPLDTMRGMLGVTPLRMALIRDLPDGAVQKIAGVQAPFTGLTADEFVKVRDWVLATGRNVVDRTVVEENKAAAFVGISSNKVHENSQVFFREGELTARIGAAITNAIEHKKKYGTLDDIFQDGVTREMIQRQDILTASMTSASAAPWQRSLAAVPLQFMTYNVRMMEQLFGDVLTPKERISLGLTHAVLYGGAAAPGVGYMMEKYRWDNPQDGGQLFDLLRYGLIDEVLTNVTGEETALSTRIAIGEGLWDFLTSVRDDGVWEVAVGPGGGILLDSMGATSKLMSNLFTGDFDHLKYDWNRLARIVTSYNRAYNYWVAQKYGVYLSRLQESEVLTDMSDMDAFLVGLGIPLREQDAIWGTVEVMQASDQHFDTHVKEMIRLSNIIDQELKDGNTDTAAEFIDDLGAMMAILEPAQRSKALQRLRNNSPLPQSIMRTLMNRGKSDAAFRLQELMQ